MRLLGILLVGIALIRNFRSFYGFVSVEGVFLEYINVWWDLRSFVVKSLKFLYSYEEGIWRNLKLGPWRSFAKTDLLYSQFSIAHQFVRSSRKTVVIWNEILKNHKNVVSFLDTSHYRYLQLDKIGTFLSRAGRRAKLDHIYFTKKILLWQWDWK